MGIRPNEVMSRDPEDLKFGEHRRVDGGTIDYDGRGKGARRSIDRVSGTIVGARGERGAGRNAVGAYAGA